MSGKLSMQSNEKRAPVEERSTKPTSTGGLPDWDAPRIFLQVVRNGSFRSAAEQLGLSINAVRRRIDDFEKQIGSVLFTRDAHGTRLTDEGSRVLATIEKIEASTFELLRTGESMADSGEVRISLTEGLGTFWLAPRVAEFQKSYPDIRVDLHCAMRSADVSRHEADIAIHLSRPTALDVKVVRLGRLHLMFFASQEYLATNGTPTTLMDLIKHRMVMQFMDDAQTREAFNSFFGDKAPPNMIAMTTNVSTANYWAVANGAGIGVFPSYAVALGGQIVPLDIPLRQSFDIWLSYHPSSGRIPRVRRMIDWLIEAFNPAKYPWFKDDFIHPDEFNALYAGKPLSHLFGVAFRSKPETDETQSS